MNNNSLIALSFCAIMDVNTQELDFINAGMTHAEYLEAVCNRYDRRLVSVSSDGGCFFNSIYALLPCVLKAAKSPKALRQQLVLFLRECHEGNHGDLGQRIADDVKDALKYKIVSSHATTRGINRKPKNAEAYFEAVSKNSVWVEGSHVPFVYVVPTS
jgi:hypothetical protein